MPVGCPTAVGSAVIVGSVSVSVGVCVSWCVYMMTSFPSLYKIVASAANGTHGWICNLTHSGSVSASAGTVTVSVNLVVSVGLVSPASRTDCP